MLTVCTGWSPAGWLEYGEAFATSFARYVDQSVELVAYVEEPVDLPRGECRSVLEIPGCSQFLTKYRDDMRATGREVRRDWKPSAKAAGYNFRWDARKFCRQGFIPLAAALECKTEYLAWFDADVVFTAGVSAREIEELLPAGYAIAYLGRRRWSEIGFQLYRLPDALPMLERFAAYYRDETVFDLDEWHSAFVFDRAREASGVPALDLTPGAEGEIWSRTYLGRFSQHLKGNRKQHARALAGLHRI